MPKRITIITALVILLIGLLVGLVLLQANPLTAYPGRDAGSFNYVGSLILKGKLPYIDAWDSKPPGIFYLNAFALWLGSGTRWGIWFVEFFSLFFASIIGFRLMREVWGVPAAIFGTITGLVGLNKILGGGNFTEEYPLLFNFLALFIFWKSLKQPQKWIYDVIIGLTLAFSFLFRPNNIGVQISIALTLLIMTIIKKEFRLFVRKMALWAGTALFIFGGVCLFFLAHHALSAMIEAAFIYNFSYTGPHANLLSGILPAFEELGIPAWIALAGYLCAIYLLIRQIRARAIEPMGLFLVIAWPIEIILSSLSGRGYGHYFISWLPVLALLSATLWYMYAPALFSSKVLDIIYRRTALVLFGFVTLTVILFRADLKTYVDTFEQILFRRSEGVQKILPVAKYIREHTTPDDTVLAWGGQAGINFLAQRESPTPYLFYPGYEISSPLSAKLINSYFTDITTHPPLYIVDAYYDDPDFTYSLDPYLRSEQRALNVKRYYQPDNLEDVFLFVEENYILDETFGHYDVYKLIDEP